MGIKENPQTKRLGKHYKCAACGGHFPSRDVDVDHIIPVVDPATGFTTWDSFVDRLYCEKENFQVLCKSCHSKKSKEEHAERKGCKEG